MKSHASIDDLPEGIDFAVVGAPARQSWKIGLNKGVSYGNQIDIRAEDYLEYFAKDEKIRLIAGYIEDMKYLSPLTSVKEKLEQSTQLFSR